MPIYRLEPIDDFMKEQSWQHTLLNVPCWVEAADENQARHVVAKAAASRPSDPENVIQSPWLSPVLTMCMEEKQPFQMEPAITVRVDGMPQSWAPPSTSADI